MSKSKNAKVNFDKLLNFLALGVGIIALIFSWQANVLSREANEISRTANQIAIESSSPLVGVYEAFKDDWIYIGVIGCHIDIGTISREYVLERSAIDEITVFNKGGASTALLNVVFNDGDKAYSNVKIYDHKVGDWQNSIPLELPITIESGTATSWYLSTEDVPQLADAFKSPDEGESKLQSLDKLTIRPKWILTFADGTVLEKTYTYWTFGTESRFDTPCSP
jgi:hypothetical protein